MKKEKHSLVERRTLYFGQLPPHLDGLKVMFLTDIHYSHRKRPLYDEVLDIIKCENPDIFILGGDLVDHRMNWCEVLNWLTRFPNIPCKVAVPGNWEYYEDETFSRFSRRMRGAGFAALCNESIIVEPKEGLPVVLVGIDDYQRGMPSLRRAFGGVSSESFCIAATHSPDIMLDVTGHEPFNLMLCGHTHGGQLRVPGFGAVVTNTAIGKKFEHGLYQLDGERKVYVSRGLGEGLIKLRVFCRPELTLVTLKHRWDC